VHSYDGRCAPSAFPRTATDGPRWRCVALLTARWALTAAATCYALALGAVLGVADHIFATAAQCCSVRWPPQARPPPPTPRSFNTSGPERTSARYGAPGNC
jgi:hypothetical protein